MVTYGWGAIPVEARTREDRLHDVAVPEGRPLPRADQGRRPERRGPGARGRRQRPNPPRRLRRAPEATNRQYAADLRHRNTSTVRRDPPRIDETAARRSALITRSNSAQSSCVPPAAVNTSRSSCAHAFGGEPLGEVVGPDHSARALDRHPLPAGPEHDRGSATPTQQTELHRRSAGDEPDRGQIGDRVVEHAGVDHRGVDRAVTCASLRRPPGRGQQPRGDERGRDRRASLPAIAELRLVRRPGREQSRFPRPRTTRSWRWAALDTGNQTAENGPPVRPVNHSNMADPARKRSLVRKTMAVLRAVAAGQDGVGLSEVARSASVPKATCLRILTDLIDEQLVVFDFESKRYAVAFGALALVGGPARP